MVWEGFGLRGEGLGVREGGRVSGTHSVAGGAVCSRLQQQTDGLPVVQRRCDVERRVPHLGERGRHTVERERERQTYSGERERGRERGRHTVERKRGRVFVVYIVLLCYNVLLFTLCDCCSLHDSCVIVVVYGVVVLLLLFMLSLCCCYCCCCLCCHCVVVIVVVQAVVVLCCCLRYSCVVLL